MPRAPKSHRDRKPKSTVRTAHDGVTVDDRSGAPDAPIRPAAPGGSLAGDARARGSLRGRRRGSAGSTSATRGAVATPFPRRGRGSGTSVGPGPAVASTHRVRSVVVG